MKPFMLMTAAVCLVSVFGWDGARAETATPAPMAGYELTDLLEVTGVPALMQVVATEGARHGRSLEPAMFPGRGGDRWGAVVGRIQSPDRLTPLIRASLEEMLRPGDAAAAQRFFSSHLGRSVIEGELSARRAMLDSEVEMQAKSASAVLIEAMTPRAALIADLKDALDLVTTNVSAGMNANFAFYRGLSDGGAMVKRLGEMEMLAMVREQESEIRSATEDWLDAYLMIAYAPLSDGELQDYVSFSRTDAGRRYNAAMFDGFGRVFEVTSYDLGRAAAEFILQTDI